MKFVLFVSLMLFFSLVAFAQAPFELTTQIQQMTNEEFKVLKNRAESGDQWSQYLIGVAYTIGAKQVRADKATAAIWLSKPALNGNPDAAFWLLYPTLKTQDPVKLRSMLKELSEQGSLGAMNLLADFAVEGVGGPNDFAEAMKWWKKSADSDSAEGQFNLGLMYLAGEGVPVNEKEGVKWLRISADKKFPLAAAKIAPMAMMTKAGLMPGPEVRKWLLCAAEAGDPLSMMNLGMAYFHEIGGPPDYVEAYKWFTLAAEWGAKDQVIDGRPGLKPKMTAEQISEAVRNAKQWDELHRPAE